ncbi:MAG TPA: porin [Albitalea sp.]|uniref:porin n=1 Tax=Piscinibacter sp. TaxID=1903157 RepID=UPI002ED04B2D
MKRSIYLAALAALASTSAFAQSSVTVYGRLNATVERQKTGSNSIYALQNNASRIGFKGLEDLGGGLKAGFLIEHGFNVDTGAQSQTAFWARESNVYLQGTFGKVRLGNMGPTAAYFALADYISMHNHDTGTSSDAFYLYPGDARNMIAYTSPTFSGLQVEAQVGLGENQRPRTNVLAANYDAGPLHLGAGWVKQDKTKELGVRGLYELGAFTVGAYFIRNEFDVLGVTNKRNSYRVSGMYAIGEGEIHANVGWAGKIKSGGTTIANSDAMQYTIGYNHNLSKRTKVYGFYTAVNNKAAAAYNVGTPGADFSSLAVGIRHNF